MTKWELCFEAEPWNWGNDTFVCRKCGMEKKRSELMVDKSCNCTKKSEKYTKCIKCGRRLRTEESQELGFGPVCYKKWKADNEKYQKEWEQATHRRYALRRLF